MYQQTMISDLTFLCSCLGVVEQPKYLAKSTLWCRSQDEKGLNLKDRVTGQSIDLAWRQNLGLWYWIYIIMLGGAIVFGILFVIRQMRLYIKPYLQNCVCVCFSTRILDMYILHTHTDTHMLMICLNPKCILAFNLILAEIIRQILPQKVCRSKLVFKPIYIYW